jgi:hypothetical protein
MKRREVFEVLEPPSHGWTRLKARLEERPRRRWRWAVAIAAAALLLAVIVWPKRPAEVSVVAELARSAAGPSFGVAPQGRALAVIEGAAERLPSSDPSVVLYRVAMVEAAPAEDTSP